MDALLIAVTVFVWVFTVCILMTALMAATYITSLSELASARAASERRLH